MPFPNFEEKQYETAANLELGRHHTAVFPAGQVLEAVVGYDVAANQPQSAPIWELLGVNAPPGLLLAPNLWQKARRQPKPADVPSSYVSLVFQYKRPFHLTKPNALQWDMWEGHSYYRFETLQHQHEILLTLQDQIDERAVVYYASPAFHEYTVLQDLQLAQSVLSTSSFVEPSTIGSHQYWTYNEAGTVGQPNPVSRHYRCHPFKRVWSSAKKRARRENLYEHLRGLSLALGIPTIGEIVDLPRWLAAYIDEFPRLIAPYQRQGVYDVVSLGAVFGEIGTSWFVADMDSP